MQTSLRLLLLAVFAVLFVGTASAHYNPQLGRWLSRDPMGEAGGFNLYAYCGNDPVNGHDPLGLQSWDPSYSPEMARRNAEGMRELWDNNGASQSMAEFAKEIEVINRRVAGGEMSVLEGTGKRVGWKGVQVVFGTIFSPFLYHDTGKAFGTYNPKTIIIDEGILNGVVHKGAENVYDAWKKRDFTSIMNAFDSGVDAFLIYKGGKASAELGFGRPAPSIPTAPFPINTGNATIHGPPSTVSPAIVNPGSRGFVLVGELTPPIITVDVPAGFPLNRVFNSGNFGSGPMGGSFTPGIVLPGSAAEASFTRGLKLAGVPQLQNDAGKAVIYLTKAPVTGIYRSAIGGSAREIYLYPEYRNFLYLDPISPVFELPPFQLALPVPQ
jgi:hypothetical protein